METAAAHLLNFEQPFDCALLDQIVAIAMDGSHPQRAAANEFLVRMKEHPDMWRRADAILDQSKQQATKFFGLQVLGETISTHWKVIQQEQREGIRNFVVTKMIGMTGSYEVMKANSTFLGRLNLVLVQILKQDWPHNWPSFISDIVGASKTSESLCENNMKVLKLLSEEVFEFSKDSMTTAKIKSMKESLNSEFSQIFQLCEFILGISQRQSLLLSTLQTLQRFLSWIPLGYVYETSLISGLISKFLPGAAYRTATVDCLTEIASLPPTDIPDVYKPNVQMLLVVFIQNLVTILPRDTNLKEAYAGGSAEGCLFVSRLALFFVTYLKSYIYLFYNPDGTLMHEAVLLEALMFLVRISEVEDEDGEIFKTCLEFWVVFTKDLYTADIQWKQLAGESRSASGYNGGGDQFGKAAVSTGGNQPKLAVFDDILHRLRIIMIDRMAKPEEVIIVEDDNGEIVREQTKDTEVLAQYKTMRECIVFLANLNYDNTESIMLEKLDQQTNGGFTWGGLNTLCWAIGSISGAMGELDEKRFLVSVIKDLLRMCEEQKGKDNKAVVASAIMYIVGQYPRFLRAHWKFLKTVVNKLFEFMHETHPGVQDMACDTFLKISQKCKRKFMTPQVEDPQPFIMTLISELHRHIVDLQPHQVQSFYESVGTMLSDQGPSIQLARDEVVLSLMHIQNNTWKTIMSNGAADVNYLITMDVVRELTKILKINTVVCKSAGAIFVHQLSFLLMDALNLFKLYSQQITAACAAQGPIAVRLTEFKAMKGVKSEILEMFSAYLDVCNEVDGGAHVFAVNFWPLISAEVLLDYHTSPPAARDAKALSFFVSTIANLKGLVTSDIQRIMEAVFQKTLEMITVNMSDYPEHRIAFFQFLHEANQHCFTGLFGGAPATQKLIVDSVVWAFKHTERNISETGLDILHALLQNIAGTAFAQQFYQQFMIPLLQDIFGVLTDRLHKSGFKQQAAILMHMCHITQMGHITAPLSSVQGADNAMFLREHIASLLMAAFPNVSKAHLVAFINGCFDVTMDITAFKQHLRDFLITIKEFESEDNSELYQEEAELRREMANQDDAEYRASVPGLVRPIDMEDDPDL